MTSPEIRQKRHFCEKCQGTTNHKIIAAEKNSLNDPDYNLEWQYFMLQCLGCDGISFRKETHDYESTYPDEYNNWTYDITVEIFPSPLIDHRIITEYYILPEQIKTVYKETVDAFKNNCNLLAGVGFRAIIEAVCNDKKIQGKTLEAKINNLAKNRFITDMEADRLHAVRFMGNDSIHDMAVPGKKVLYVVLEIVEHLLKNLYIIDHHAKPVLDSLINDYEDFEKLLSKNLKKFEKDDDFPLAKYLAKDVRRLKGQLDKFEVELVSAIKKGDFNLLKLGEFKPFGDNAAESFQHFIKTK